MTEQDKIKKISINTQCGLTLSRDLLILAGGNADLVIHASRIAHGINHLKALIIDARFKEITNG